MAIPLISGTAQEGNVLGISIGDWSNLPTSYTRQWMRCDAAGANATIIPSATGAWYRLVAADVGSTIRCWVSAFNDLGVSAAVLTAQTGVISAVAPAVPAVTTVPTIVGEPTLGQQLTISNGSWTNAPTSYTHCFNRCDANGANCEIIAGQNCNAYNNTYVLQAADVGKTIRAYTTAINATGSSTPSFSAATAVIVGAAPPPPPPAKIDWRGDFETGNFSQWGNNLQQKASGRATVVTSPRRQGAYAGRCEVRAGDNNVAGSGSGERCEWYSGSATNAEEGVEEWWAWSTYFDSFQFSDSGGAWSWYTQFHNSGASGQANVGWYATDTKIGFRATSGGDPNNPVMRYYTLLANRVNKKWYDHVLHIKWSRSDSVGFYECWLNGVQVLPKTMGASLYTGQSAYLKQGYYRGSGVNNTAVIIHDGMRRGTSYAAVAAEFA